MWNAEQMANHLCLSDIYAKCLWWGGLTEEYTFPKSLFPSEPQPSSLSSESTFRLCFSSCAYHHMLCRLGMWTARLSTLCMYCHIHFPETTPIRIHYLSEVLKRSLRLPARSQSWLTSFCVFFPYPNPFLSLCFGEVLQDFMVEARAMCWEALHVWTRFGKIAVSLSLKWRPVWTLQLFTGVVSTFTKMWKQSLVTAQYTDTAQ